MKKIKVNFEYVCEIEIKPEEVQGIKQKNLNSTENIALLSDEINKMFLSDDGRTEAGGIVNFNFEIVDNYRN